VRVHEHDEVLQHEACSRPLAAPTAPRRGLWASVA
jgi:hypothetical protein